MGDDRTKTSGGEVEVGPNVVGVTGAGGSARAGEGGVAVAGLGSIYNVSPGSKAVADQFGVAITSHDGVSTAGAHGVAVSGKKGSATVAHLGVATVSDNGTAMASDGGVAHVYGYNGVAEATYGVAYCVHGDLARASHGGTAIAEVGIANAGDFGIASMRCKGRAVVGGGGLAIVWNESPQKVGQVDSDAGIVMAGEGSVVIAIHVDPVTGERRPAIGLVGSFKSPPVLQHGLMPGSTYRFDSVADAFIEVFIDPREQAGDRKADGESDKKTD